MFYFIEFIHAEYINETSLCMYQSICINTNTKRRFIQQDDFKASKTIVFSFFYLEIFYKKKKNVIYKYFKFALILANSFLREGKYVTTFTQATIGKSMNIIFAFILDRYMNQNFKF